MLGWSSAELDSYGRGDLEEFTAKTVASHAALLSRMEQVRIDRVAWTMGEFAEEINGAAAPIVDRAGLVVGAINVSGPTYRFPGTRTQAEIEGALVAACAQVSDRL